jgi:hypothetical protein
MYVMMKLRLAACVAAMITGAVFPSFPLMAQQRLDALPDAPSVTQAAQTETAPTAAEKQKATDDEVKREEKQRILGIMPEFNAVIENGEYRPLTPKQKFHLMFKSSTDPFIFLLDGIVSGIGQAKDSNPGFGQGAQGYAKRFGSSYADTFDGNFWGNAVLPIAFHEDPRYFRKGTGPFINRFLYSAATTLWCRRDNGRWGPNYANVLGNLIAGGISNTYYPASDRGLGKTFSGAATVTAEGVVGAELIEFWPDIYRHFSPDKYRRSHPLPPAGGQGPQAAPAVAPVTADKPQQN